MKAIRALPRRAAGAPLPPLLQGHLQRLFGARLHEVRVVISDAPARLAACAFAHGNTVHLGPDFPRARPGVQRQVLGHEIAHVLQQRAGATRRWLGRLADVPALEHEAERCARRIGAGRAAVLAPRRQRRPALCIQRIKLVLRGTKDGDLDAPALLNLMDAALASKFAGAAACANVGGLFTVTEGGHWLSLLGKLAMRPAIVPFNTQRNSALPCTLKVGGTGARIPVYAFGGTTERLDFPIGAVRWARGAAVDHVRDGDLKRDLNYIQIADGFARLNRSGHEDSDIADGLLLKMKGGGMATDFGADGNLFIEAMVALMFGVEASRFPSAFVASLMLLDLVRTKKTYGRAGTKRFNLKSAFDSGKSFDFDCLYGGKFPCAVHEPGKGNASNRRMLGELGGQANANATVRGGFTRGEGVLMMMELNHRFIVPRREVTLLIHWLEARVGTAAIPYLRKATLQGIIASRIDEATALGIMVPALPYSPSPTSGMHSADAPGRRTTLRLGMRVYWLKYEKFNRKTKAYTWENGVSIHADQGCKMIGGRELGARNLMVISYAASPDARPQLEAFREWTLASNEDLGNARRQACPHCCSA